MKTNYLKFGAITLLIGFALTLSFCSSDTEDEANEGATETSTNPDSLCYENPSWFPHTQTPAPKEGIGSPFDTSSTTNQIFHQWSWQKFLWLTKPDAGGNPLFLNQAKVIQVDANMNPLTIPSGVTVVLTDTEQAGPAQAILQVNPAYSGNSGTGQTVYYSIHSNGTMLSAAKSFADSLANGDLPANNFATFPVGSFELKVSWVDVAAIPSNKLNAYYVTTASLAGVNTQVALLGMHVVGVVQNHPEFIWATFEHDDLAPAYDWSAGSASSTVQKLLFSTGSTTGIGAILYNTATGLGNPPNKVFDLFKYGVPRNQDGSLMTTSQSEPENYNNIDGINTCVKSNLTDVWKNYFYNGSIWLNMDGKTPQQQAQLIVSLGYGIGSGVTGASARGSLNNANVSMETFAQTFNTSISQINVNTLANCFSCHQSSNISGNTSPIYLSHIFDSYLHQQQGKTAKEIQDLKLKHEKLTFGKK